MTSIDAWARRIRPLVHPLTGHASDYDPLMEMVGDARLVLLGEASHGTHEFYHERAVITRRLIEEKGFTMVIVEADWPDAYRVNRFVRGTGEDASANAALADFRRFPTWMWRNVDTLTLVDWLREYNDTLSAAHPKVGFYGMDLYSLQRSVEAVIEYLDEVDPDAAQRARGRYSCFEGFGGDSQAYGYAADLGITPSCEDVAVQQLVELQSRAADLASRDGRIPEDEFFFAEQNARLVRNAEEYYRTMFRGRVSSWNLRDSHMTETIDALLRHMERKGVGSRAVVWAHNSHLGDASATEMGEGGEHNVGQLARQHWGDDALLVGFTTHAGTVTAATDWDEPARNRRVRPGMDGSWEDLFHRVGEDRFFLDLRRRGLPELKGQLLERAIGVIYRPETERMSHYFHARLAEQFDAVIHIDQTAALEPLEQGELWHRGEEAPETYPSGL
jgi:erythromycin esterase-like protein